MRATPRGSWIALIALAFAFFAQSYSASRLKSPTWDEPFHMAVGLAYIETGSIFSTLANTPLLREIAACLLPAVGIDWPDSEIGNRVITVTQPDFHTAIGLQYAAGREIMHAKGPDRVLFWSRLPMILLATGFIFIIYLLGRATFGNGAGLGAAFLYAFDPNILAQSFLTTTDAGLAFFAVLFAFAVWSYIQRQTLWRLLFSGVALGAVLSAKYTAIVLLPTAALWLTASAIWPPAAAPPTPLRARLIRNACAFAGMCLAAILAMECIYLFPPNLFHVYFAGLGEVTETPEGIFFMAGKLAHRFYGYFVVTWLLKEPLAIIFAVALGLFLTVRQWKTTYFRTAFLLLPAAAFLTIYSLLANDFGIRYIDVVLPFMHIFGGVGLAALFSSTSRKARISGVVLSTWVLAAAAGIYPDHLSYFNETACLLTDPSKIGFDGGSSCGIKWLDESNVDLGGGLKQLKSWMNQHFPGQRFHIGYFGSFPPEYYYMNCDVLSADEALKGKMRGPVAMSAYFVASLPQRFHRADGEWMQKMKPVAIVGHSYYIFDLK